MSEITEKIKLNLKCWVCNKSIYLGEGSIHENKPLHINCLKEQIKEETLKKVILEIQKIRAYIQNYMGKNDSNLMRLDFADKLEELEQKLEVLE